MAAHRGTAWAGWILFAGTMLILVGMINLFQGLVAIIWDDRVVVTENNFVLVDLTSWGWTILFFGLVMIAVSFGLFAAQTWARVAAIVVVIVNAVSQIAWLGAYPIWSLLMIALDTVVLFALTARWSEAREDLDSYDGANASAPLRDANEKAFEMQGYQRKVT